MKLAPLSVVCPQCGSPDVIYSCNPACCFNHVCGDCLASFELVTRPVGQEMLPGDIPTTEKDACSPTAECACCHGMEVYLVAEGDGNTTRALCASCHALLELACQFQ
ncbi:MAG: hypothetical protein HY652_03265 [Acidobacteria bacterium]|nr:hypothetical protein [Acidobacteriota bacterium]